MVCSSTAAACKQKIQAGINTAGKVGGHWSGQQRPLTHLSNSVRLAHVFTRSIAHGRNTHTISGCGLQGCVESAHLAQACNACRAGGSHWPSSPRASRRRDVAACNAATRGLAWAASQCYLAAVARQNWPLGRGLMVEAQGSQTDGWSRRCT